MGLLSTIAMNDKSLSEHIGIRAPTIERVLQTDIVDVTLYAAEGAVKTAPSLSFLCENTAEYLSDPAATSSPQPDQPSRFA